MIISASRRTDIPAFYSEWFFNRLAEGFAYVRNPFNSHRISKVSVDPEVVDCIVFWTKNPKAMLERLDDLRNYRYYFQFTLNPYDKTVEVNVPGKSEIIESFIRLSESVGSKRVIWRYDPILLTDRYTKEYHYKYFDYLAGKLHKYTGKCVISFIDIYAKTQRNMKHIQLLPLAEADMLEMAGNLSSIAGKYGLRIEACSENIDLGSLGIRKSSCIDGKLISELLGQELLFKKDKNQRESCGCAASIDIGEYNTCNNNCLYCYANFNSDSVNKNIARHNPAAPLLIGDICEKDVIVERAMLSYRDNTEKQISMFTRHCRS